MDQNARLRQGSLLIVIPCLIAVAALTYMSPRFLPPQSDEFHSVWPAQRLLRGDLVYVEVFSHRPPVDLVTNAAALGVLGESVTTSRLLQVLSMVITGYLLFALLRRWGATDWEASGAALLPACLCFPFWPVPSSHWQVLPYVMGAILLLESARREDGEPSSLGKIAGAGALGAMAGLTIQTEGALVCAWLFLRTLGGSDPRRELPPLLGGIALPLVLCGGILAACGALTGAYRCVVHFPLFHYKAGFNDVSFFGDLAETYGFVMQKHGFGAVALMAAGLALPLGVLGFGLVRLYRQRTRRDLACMAWLFVILAVFLKARTDWAHVVFSIPFLLVLWFEFALREDTPRALRRTTWGWLLGALLAGGGLLLATWGRGIQPREGLSLDLLFRHNVTRVLSSLPPDLRKEPVLALPYGATFYFFRSAEAPGMDWVYLPSMGYNLPEQHQELADWVERGPIPVVILQRTPRGVGFLREEGPLKESLQNYALHADMGDFLVFVRKGLLKRRTKPKRGDPR